MFLAISNIKWKNKYRLAVKFLPSSHIFAMVVLCPENISLDTLFDFCKAEDPLAMFSFIYDLLSCVPFTLNKLGPWNTDINEFLWNPYLIFIFTFRDNLLQNIKLVFNSLPSSFLGSKCLLRDTEFVIHLVLNITMLNERVKRNLDNYIFTLPMIILCNTSYNFFKALTGGKSCSKGIKLQLQNSPSQTTKFCVLISRIAVHLLLLHEVETSLAISFWGCQYHPSL